MLLQSVGGLGDQFVLANEKEGQLREMNLLDLKADDTKASASIADVFAMLPNKTVDPSPEGAEAYRKVSDEACKMGFALLQNSANQAAFKRTARSLLCVKATRTTSSIQWRHSKTPPWRMRSGGRICWPRRSMRSTVRQAPTRQ
jgi:hypothetical protein